MSAFWHVGIAKDAAVQDAILAELKRESRGIELIASENIVSRAVLEAQGSVLTNKYAEGYPGKRYYGGCAPADAVENLAIERAKLLFGCRYANVQPHSGSQANQAVFLALMQPGDTYMGLRLDHGGHLTHGSPVNQSGKWFKPVHYGLGPDERIDYDALERMAHEVKPKVIVAGGSAYPRQIDFARMSAIAKAVGAYLMVDMAHIAGLVAVGAHPSPFPHADVVTTTTHKTLRGPRGGMILANDDVLAKKLASAVFPGMQGGPLMHVIAAKAVAFGEALQPEFKDYIGNVVANCRVLADTLTARGLRMVSGGTDTHLCLVDLRTYGLAGNVAETLLDEAGLTCNKNGVPFDDAPPTVTSGIRLGSPAATTRGLGEVEFRQVGEWIADILVAAREGDATAAVARVRAEVLALCERFPIYPA